MIAALSDGIVDSPFPPVREGILDGPGSLDWRFPARTPADEAGRELLQVPAALLLLPLAMPVVPAVPVDRRLFDVLLPAEEVDLADDLLPSLPSSLRLALRDCNDGRLLCLDSNDLGLLLLPAAVAGRLPFFFLFVVVVVVIAAVPGLLLLVLVLVLVLVLILPSPSPSPSPSPTDSSVSISSAKSTAGAFFLRLCCCCCTDAAAAVAAAVRATVCVPDVLVGEPSAIVPRLAVLLVGLPAEDLPLPLPTALVVVVPGRLPAGDLDLEPALLLVVPLDAAAPPLPPGRPPAGDLDLDLVLTGDRDRALAAIATVLSVAAAAVVVLAGDLARIAAARALAAWVIRTGDRDRDRSRVPVLLLPPPLVGALPPVPRFVFFVIILLFWLLLSLSSSLVATTCFLALAVAVALALVLTLAGGGRLGES